MSILEVSGIRKVYTSRFGGNKVEALRNKVILMILASIEFNKSINSKEFDKSYLALSKILHSDMRDFFQTDFGKEYYQKWLKEHGKNKPKYTQYDYEEDEDE